MRSFWAKLLVRWVSGWIQTAYEINCIGGLRWLEIAAGRFGVAAQKVVFPIAELLDKEAMVTQMIDECWWG